jgi:hypothetical protein
MPAMRLKIAGLLLTLLAGIGTVAAGTGALAAFDALPDKYARGVLKLTADNADPNPDTWYFTAQADGPRSPMHSITVEAGQVVQDKPILGLRAIFENPSPIDFAKIGVDSEAAYAIAAKYAAANNNQLGGVSFALNQKGSDATPIWSVWCYTPRGGYLGRLDLLASDGAVISNDAFPAAP